MGAVIRLDEPHARAYVAEPETGGQGRVLVIHDAYGLLPHIRFLCDELAGHGLVAVAPDLFAGSTALSDARASRMLEQLSAARAARVLDAALRAFDVVGHRLGPRAVIGFSIGAEFAFGLIARTSLQAGVAYYGMPSQEHRDAISGPLLLHWAARDRWDDDCTPERAVTDLRARGIDVETHTYPDVGHGFANADSAAFDLDAAEQAWDRTLRFLTDRLSVA